MRVNGVGGAKMNRVQGVEAVQRRPRNGVQNRMRINTRNRNRIERTIDRMARAGNVVKNNATDRMKVFYKALRKSMINFMG